MSQPASTPKSFEAAITELEAIVQKMESGALSLEQSLDHYQHGIGLLKFCQNTLSSAEQRIQQLEKDSLVDLPPSSETTE